MKIRTALSVICAMSTLVVFTGSTSACPNLFGVSLDRATVTCNLNQTPRMPDTVRGSVKFYSESLDDNVKLKVSISAPTYWSVLTKIGGSIVQDGDIIELTRGESRSVEVIVVPNSNEVATDSFSITLTDGCVAKQSLALITTNTTAAVSSELPISDVTLVPNPAGSYIFANGLSNNQSGYRYEIFSTTGAEVGYGALPADARINVQYLPSGAYRLRLFDAKRIYSNTAFTVLH